MDFGGDVRLDSHTSNLRDLLRIREDSSNHPQQQRRTNCSGLTLLAVLAETRGPSPPPDVPPRPSLHSTRTLLEIIREDRVVGCRRSWRQLRDRIRRGGGNTSAPPSQLPNLVTAPGRSVEQPARTSLMALLENDWQLGSGASQVTEEEEEEEEIAVPPLVEAEEGGGGSVGGYDNCCVCMVRHKGAAFIPCGHTFCRLCSREVWVQRGHCPLCNHYILEILDIF